MAREEIIVEIDEETADVQVRVEGVAGPACEALTADIEAALGETTKKVRTREYSQPNRTGTRTRATQR